MYNQDEASTPESTIKLNGKEIGGDSAELVEAMVMQDHTAPDLCRLVLNNSSQRFTGTDEVEPGQSVEVSLGVSGGSTGQGMFKGEVVGVEAIFEEKDRAIYIVRAYDKLHRLTRAKNTKTWLDIKDSDLASEIAGNHGLGTDVEDTKFVQSYVIQHNQTDYEFLRWRAWRLGLEVDCVDEKLVFKKPAYDDSSGVTIKLGKNLKRMRFLASTAWQVKKQEVRGWDSEQKKEFVGKAAAGDEWSLLGGAKSGSDLSGKHGDSTAILVNVPVSSQEEIDAIAVAHLNIHASKFLSLDLAANGESQIRARKTIAIEGVDDRFCGDYYVTHCRHVLRAGHGMNKGYLTYARCMRTAM